MSKEFSQTFVPGGLLFTKDGRWLNGGAEVTHQGIYDYLSKRVRFDDALGEFVVTLDGQLVVIEVEDTPFVVRTIDSSSDPWRVILNDGSSEEFLPATLQLGADNALYCQAKGFQLRLLRPANQALQPYIVQTQAGFALSLNGKEFPITVRS